MAMLTSTHRRLLESHGMLLARILIALLFFVSGITMFLAGSAAIGGHFASLNMPFPILAYWIAVIVKIGAGLMLIVGYRVGCAAALLIGFTLLATYFAFRDLTDMNTINQILKNLALVGGLLYVMAYGAGTGWKIGK